MTKQEFFASQDKLRAGYELQSYQPETCENDLLPSEEQDALKALGNQKSGIFRTKDLHFEGLLCVEIYIGKTIKVRRNKVDELDNVYKSVLKKCLSIKLFVLR